MSRPCSSVTDRLRIKGRLVQAPIAAGLYRRMERRAAAEDRPVEEVIRDELAPLVPERRWGRPR